MANLTQQKRQRMLEFLQTIREEHKDDDDVLIAIGEIESELNAKKYGLVWEHHEEAVDIQMRDNIPIFTECTDKEINASADGVYNFILEGDNLHSLRLLEKTHSGKIDLIYIDPPYNTGGRDFIYDDAFVDNTDTFRHSKWLSFMATRLGRAKELLSPEGLIFISIDDNEVAQLKLLCDEIFGANNFRGQIARSTGTPTGQGNAIISNEIDYMLVYARTEQAIFNGLPFDDESSKIYNLEDEYGRYLVRPLRKTGGEDRHEDRPSMYYPVTAPDGTQIYPIAPAGYESRWRCQESTYISLRNEHRIEWKKDKSGWKVYQKFYLEGRTKQPGNLWTGIEGNKKATITIKNIFGDNVFSFPKPVELISRIIHIASKPDSIVLDFFAGSGTTGQAVLEYNRDNDGSNRTFILCTNNENNICEEVTYERIRRIISGYGKTAGIPADVKYYRTDFVSKDAEDISEELLAHITEMVQLEHGVKIDGSEYLIIMNDDELDAIEQNWDNCGNVKAMYVSKNVLFTTAQKKLFGNIDIHIIPDNYFQFELKEVGEAW
jgi:hypothetical protein